MKLVKTGEGLANASVTYTLSLKTETTLILWITPDDGYTVSAFSDGSNTYQAVKSGSRYKITIPNIPAHELGTAIELTGTVTNGTTTGTITIELSPMSYVYSVLSSSDPAFQMENAKNAVCALYQYYDAAWKYKN